MYNYSIKITYLDIEDAKQDTQYRKELLDIFNITEYNYHLISNTMKIIFDKYKEHKQIKNILEQVITHENKFPINLDKETAFMMLFSFQNFYFFHKALCDLERNLTINSELYDKLIKNLQKK